MGANDFAVVYGRVGKALIVEIFVERVIAEWWVLHVSGAQTLGTFEGRTDDRIADVAPVDVASLVLGSSLSWIVLLYGPAVGMKVNVQIDVRQGATLLGSRAVEVDLPASKAEFISGTIGLAAQ